MKSMLASKKFRQGLTIAEFIWLQACNQAALLCLDVTIRPNRPETKSHTVAGMGIAAKAWLSVSKALMVEPSTILLKYSPEF
jgi:hypothetical protein